MIHNYIFINELAKCRKIKFRSVGIPNQFRLAQIFIFFQNVLFAKYRKYRA